MVPRCLTIAGSDSGGGAGIQADLKAFAHLGCHGMSAIVALTAQNTVGVSGITEAPAAFIEAELEAVFSDIGVDSAKTGMLFSAAIIETVAEFLEQHPVPLVVDPVLVASSGAQLIQPDAAAILVKRLMPLATVVTPNLPEGVWAGRAPLRRRRRPEGARGDDPRLRSRRCRRNWWPRGGARRLALRRRAPRRDRGRTTRPRCHARGWLHALRGARRFSCARRVDRTSGPRRGPDGERGGTERTWRARQG